jgi:hypothetical protein
LELEVDHDKILSGEQKYDTGPRLKSNISRLFYAKWKLLDIHLHPNICKTMDQLMDATYSKIYQHPFGNFETNLTYIDRVCW